MKYDSQKIPYVLQETELGKASLNEVIYKQKTLSELKFLSENISLSSKSLYFLELIARLFSLPTSKISSEDFIKNQLKVVIQAFQEIGTAESFLKLFRIFLGVEVDIELINKKAGSLLLKMRDYPHYNSHQVIVDSTKKYGFLVPREDKDMSKLIIGVSDSHFVNNFYLFIQSIKGAGIEIEIQEPQQD